MSLPRPHGHRISPEQRNLIHRQVCADQTPDPRFGSELSHAQKVAYICGVLGYPEAVFDLEVPFPLEDWAASEDNSLMFAGLYLTTLRFEFYSKQMTADAEAETACFKEIAETEFWNFGFRQLLKRRTLGNFTPDDRVIH